MEHISESLRIAEQLASTSLDSRGGNKFRPMKTVGYVPPKHLLQYMVRMGSFSAKPYRPQDSMEDTKVEPPSTPGELLPWVRRHIDHLPPHPCREYLHRSVRSPPSTEGPPPTKFRLMQWNILAQALGSQSDNFSRCPKEALDWKCRRFRILEEILTHDADLLCFQEVDHYDFLEKVLTIRGYTGLFVPKPDSPCLYQPLNSGPDGCAVFVRSSKFRILAHQSKVLEVWGVKSNQVALLVELQHLDSGQQLLLLTTHLKARQGALLTQLREQQGYDLLQFISGFGKTRPLVLCGDLNAEPTEPLYRTLTVNGGLSSAYAELHGDEPPYSTWKIRGDGEYKRNLDYVMYNDGEAGCLEALGCLVHPTEEDIGQDRAPSFTFPSDHFSLVCDFSLTDGKRSSKDSGKETARDVGIRGEDQRETANGDDVREETANDDKDDSFKGNKREDFEDKDAKLKGECFESKCTIRGLETKDVNFRGEDGKEKDCNDDQFKNEDGKDKDKNIDDSQNHKHR